MTIKIRLAANLFKNCTPLEEKRIREKLLEYQTHGLNHGADLKKIAENHYQLRINRESRLDLIKDQDGDNTFYIAVQARPHHEDIAPLSQNYISTASIPCEASSSSATSGHLETVELSDYPGSFSYYNNTYIHLDERQVEASTLKMPFILSGAPGSGKTCAALEILINVATSESEKNSTELSRILFITENPNLAKSVEQMFLQTDTLLPDHIQILFRTPAQLYTEKHPEAQLLCENGVDETEHCLAWLKTEIKKTDLLSKDEVEKAYQEFRIISKYKTEEEYLVNKGSQDTGYPDNIEKRKWLFAAMGRYRKSLGTTINLQFTAIESSHTYQAIVYDEALDGSRIQQSSIISLAENGNIAILAGHHQGLSDNTNSSHFIEQELFTQFKKEATHTVLTTSYRSFAENIHFSNAILQLKYHFSGGIAFKREMSFIHPPHDGRRGALNYAKTIEELGTLPLDDIHFAIIYDPKHKQEIIDNFGQVNETTGEKELPDCAYTTKECKGLEFRSVVMYKPFTGSKQAIFEKMSRSLPDITSLHYQEDLDKVSRPGKQATIDMEYNTILNRLFVGTSRAKQKLVFFQPKNAKTRRLEEFSEDAVNRINSPRPTSEALPTQSITPSDEKVVADTQSETKTMIISLYKTGLEKNKNRAIKALERLLKTSSLLAQEIISELSIEDSFFKKQEEMAASVETEGPEERRIKDIILKLKKLRPSKRTTLIKELTLHTPSSSSLLYESFDFPELLNELLSLLTINEKASLVTHLEFILENYIQVFGEDEAPDEYAEIILKSWNKILDHYPTLISKTKWIDDFHEKSILSYDNQLQSMSSFFFVKFLMLMINHNRKILLNSKIFAYILLTKKDGHSAFIEILRVHGEEFFLYLCENAPETIASPAFSNFACFLSLESLALLPTHNSWENVKRLTSPGTSSPIPMEVVQQLTWPSLKTLLFKPGHNFHEKIISNNNVQMLMIDYLFVYRITDLQATTLPPELLTSMITRLTAKGQQFNQSILLFTLLKKGGTKLVYTFLINQKARMIPDNWGLILKDIFSSQAWREKLDNCEDSVKLMSLLYTECIYQEDGPYYQIAKNMILQSVPTLITNPRGLICLKLAVSIQSASDFTEAVSKSIASEIVKLLAPTSKTPSTGQQALQTLLTVPTINVSLLLALHSNLGELEKSRIKEVLRNLFTNTTSRPIFASLETHPAIDKSATLSALFSELQVDRIPAQKQIENNTQPDTELDHLNNLAVILASDFISAQDCNIDKSRQKLARWEADLKHFPAMSSNLSFLFKAHTLALKKCTNEADMMTSYFYHQFILKLMSHNKKILVGCTLFEKLLLISERSPLAEICTYYGNEFIMELIDNAPELFESATFLEIALFNEEIRSSIPPFPLLDMIQNALDSASNEPIPLHFFNIHGFSLVGNLIGHKKTENIIKKMVSAEKDLSVIDYFISEKSAQFSDYLLIHFRNKEVHIPTFISQTTTISTAGHSLLSTVLTSNPKKIQELYEALLEKKSSLGPTEYGSILIALASINSTILKMNPEYGRKLLCFLLFGTAYTQSNPSFNSAVSAASLLIPELLNDKKGLISLNLLAAIQTDAHFWESLIPCISKVLCKSSPSVDALSTVLKNRHINSAVLLSLYSNEVSAELANMINCALIGLKMNDHETFSMMAKDSGISKHAKLSALFSKCDAVKVSVINGSMFKPTGKEDKVDNKASSSKARHH